MPGYGEDFAAAAGEFRRRLKTKGGLVGYGAEAAGEAGRELADFYESQQEAVKPALRAAGELITGDPGLIPGATAPPRGAVGAVMSPNPKEQDAAATRSVATAAIAGYHAGQSGHPVTKAPAPPADTKQEKAGTGPPLRQTEAQEHQARTVPVETQDGRIIWTDPETALAYGRAGATGVNRQEALAKSGSPEKPWDTYRGANVAKGSSGSAYLRPSQKVQLPTAPDRRPYSAQVETLNATIPRIDVNAPSSGMRATGGYVEGGKGPRETTRTLSGLEQATSRREWLESRADQERAQELAEAQSGRQLAEANVDPLELAKIQAQGKYGGDVAKVALDMETRRQALADYGMVHAKIEAARDELAKARPGSPEEMRLKDYIDILEREARDRANIIGGQRLYDPRPDMWSAFSGFASGSTPAGPGTPAPGAK